MWVKLTRSYNCVMSKIWASGLYTWIINIIEDISEEQNIFCHNYQVSQRYTRNIWDFTSYATIRKMGATRNSPKWYLYADFTFAKWRNKIIVTDVRARCHSAVIIIADSLALMRDIFAEDKSLAIRAARKIDVTDTISPLYIRLGE